MDISNFLVPTLLALSLYRYFTVGRFEAPILFAVYFFISSIFPFAKNAFTASRTGLPRIHVFWHPHSFIWMVAGVPLRPYLKRYLPSWIWDRLAPTIYGWEFQEGMRPFDNFAAPQGDKKSFWLVSCGEPELYTWDREIVKQVLMKHQYFHQLKLTAFFLEKFGKSLFTSNGESWARQRKVLAAVVNEKISKTVFGETIKQSEGLVNEVTKKDALNGGKGVAETNQVFDMLKKVTIHVLSGAGMGTTVSWASDGGEKKLKPGMKMDYMDACKIVTGATMGPIILPQWFTSNYPSWLPRHDFMRNLSVAMREFPVHTGDLLDLERERQSSAAAEKGAASGTGNAMSALLQHAKTEQNPSGLTEDEIRGNLFIFTVAGFETTANTLSYSIMLLIRHPSWQKWLFEEIDAIVPASGPADEELDYQSLFPKCQRILAFMFETLRFHPPLVHIVKETQGEQVLTTEKGKEVRIPDGTLVYLDAVALHLDPEVYRNVNIDTTRYEKESDDDELKFRPTRWLNQSSDSKITMFSPPKGSFLPWSMGPRSCPGQKMSQVEFVAVILTLLRRHSIEVVKLEGESDEEATARIESWVANSFSKATLEMNGVYDITGEEGGFKVGLRRRR
ncbi:Cytochrome P450 monooxygenase [Pseudocercospora fuligena]|uniref:Cytochrome P450 monooxygenase n=1 Tax=Pseudocercospora fuligena TaxID=685502 RepID=A0A8H6RLQ6_9PEZI|nr:Cytochrome P450 monooxygenase [Pseudocercospora fuligena]